MQIEVNTFILHKQWTPQSGHAMPTWSSPGGTGPPFSSELSPSLEGHRSSGSGEHTCPRSHLQISLLARGRVPPAPAPDWTPGHLHTHTHTTENSECFHPQGTYISPHMSNNVKVNANANGWHSEAKEVKLKSYGLPGQLQTTPHSERDTWANSPYYKVYMAKVKGITKGFKLKSI